MYSLPLYDRAGRARIHTAAAAHTFLLPDLVRQAYINAVLRANLYAQAAAAARICNIVTTCDSIIHNNASLLNAPP